MGVPNTTTFTFQDVTTTVYGDTAAGRNLSTALTIDAVDSLFDSNYVGSKTGLLNFRNYAAASACAFTTTFVRQLSVPIIDANTTILIYFDSSGSMNSTLTPLTTAKNDAQYIKALLLPYYNNNATTYNSKVTIVNHATERTFDMVNFLGATAPSGNIVVMVFQDESSPYGASNAGTADTELAADIAALRTRLTAFHSTSPTYFRAVVFQVSGYNDFKLLIKKVEDGVSPYSGAAGLSDKVEIGYVYDVTDGGTPRYYTDLIGAALNDLNIST